MSAIDNEVLKMFNTLNPTRQGQLLDLLGQLIEEQSAQQHQERQEMGRGDRPLASSARA